MTNSLENGKLYVRSIVAGVHIELTHRLVAKVLGMSRKYKNENAPDRKTCLLNGKAVFFLPGVDINKQLTHSSLTCEAKILFTILMRCLIPRATSKELVTDKFIELMYLIANGFEVDAPSVIMEHMIFCSQKGRNHSLPFANILPLFFEHFKIPLDNEEKVTNGFGLVDEGALERIGICQNKSGDWKFYSELTQAEFDEKKFLKPRVTSSKSPTGSMDIQQINLRLGNLEKSVDEIKTEFGQFKTSMVNVEKQMEEVLTILRRSDVTYTSGESGSESESGSDSDSDADKEEQVVTPEGGVTSKDLFEDNEEQETEVEVTTADEETAQDEDTLAEFMQKSTKKKGSEKDKGKGKEAAVDSSEEDQDRMDDFGSEEED